MCNTQLWHFGLVTSLSITSYQKFFLSIPVEDKLVTPALQYESQHLLQYQITEAQSLFQNRDVALSSHAKDI